MMNPINVVSSNATLAYLSTVPGGYWIAPVAAIAALLMARVLGGSVMRRSEGDARMIEIADAVRKGAMAYLKAQYKVVFSVFGFLLCILGLLSAMQLQPRLTMLGVPIAGFLSGLCGWLGMKMATNASARTAAAAKESLNDGLTVAFRAGAVMGLNVVGFALLDASVWFLLFNLFGKSFGIDPATGPGVVELTTIMLSFGMGASLQALFARVGGGIYTKAADVGADLVGKVEAGIPEDDPRNPATIADNVGDNVGDVAGMGADLYESYYGSILAAMALGAAAAVGMHTLGSGEQARLALMLAVAPLALAGVGILASIVGIFAVKTSENATFAQLLGGLNRGVYTASALMVVAAFVVPYFLFAGFATAEQLLPWWRLGISILAGLLSGLVIARWTEYCTSYEHPPTRGIAFQGHTGPATVIIAGIAEGMKSVWASVIAVTVAILVAFIAAGGGEHFLLGLYGVAIAAVGMLATLGITLATDAYGPIADNAGGNAEMSGQPPHVRHRTDMLDSLGNTTAATGKGFAIGSAALTALALVAAYIQVAHGQLHAQLSRDAELNRAEAVKAQGPIAIYSGYGRFGVVLRENDTTFAFDGAILLDRESVEELHFDETIKRGQVFALAPVGETSDGHDHAGHDHAGHDHADHAHEHDAAAKPAASLEPARRYRLTASVGHGDHSHEYAFTVVGTRNAGIKEILSYFDVTLTNPRVLGGMFIGTMLTFLFCALTMSAVGRAAYSMMQECRRQFGLIRASLRAGGMSDDRIADPSNWPASVTINGRQYPDYATCVQISTVGAQREMVVPSILAVIVPILVGLFLSVPGVVGMLVGGLTCGFAVAVFMANAGGAWDNAKKYLESFGKITADKLLADPNGSGVPEQLRESLIARATEYKRLGQGAAIVYGKGSDDHKACVVGDTVGDPFKDTSGPSLNILIKLISIVSVVAAGVVVKFGPVVGHLIGLD